MEFFDFEEGDILGDQGIKTTSDIFLGDTLGDENYTSVQLRQQDKRQSKTRWRSGDQNIYKYFIFRDHSHLMPANLDKKLKMVFMQVVHEQFKVYALNVCANSYNRKKKYFKPL
jgi:hypothetical protein